MRNLSAKCCRENYDVKHNTLCSITFSENRAVYDIMWKKYGSARQATDDNMVHEISMLYN
jgi:hypothetical protein